MKQEATINGLIDGISVVEKDNKRYDYHEAVVITDILHNEQEIDEEAFEDLYREEGFTVSDYDPELFNGSINLLSENEEEISGSWEEEPDL
jgi:hypothetical protein